MQIKRNEKGKKIQQDCIRKAVIVQCIRCIIRELNPESCGAAYTSFSAEGLMF
jgi:hypothetical protein